MTRARDLASGLSGVRPFASSTGTGTASGFFGPINGWYYTNSTTFTFPAGRFTVAPIVSVTAQFSGGLCAANIDSAPTTTGFSVYVQRNNASANGASVHWQAIQMTSGSASG